ncbi:phosphotransferase family protein [Thermoflavimicrobium dichotomicum]|uniref:TIGR02172 family protein n=1 Tax=Thermoflavimicrobium dichotomicum TaxID=46223 RepID=A0A1I3NYT2_9BACL|nr:aminoglycoside phosphotransferase family protein [Thermoflavimicrobium dichotomicum]SFJ14369.1 TIGR02172 family protein [Thermoflavimicrobium dichotomicum]
MTDVTKIREGRTAEIYTWEDEIMIKVFRENIPIAAIYHEFTIHQKIKELSLPIPKVYGISDFKGKKGIIYERIEGSTITQAITKNPFTMKKHAILMARLHLDMHKIDGQELPLQKETLKENITLAPLLDKHTKNKIIRYVDSLPEGSQVCHGDFHPDNILLSPQGPVIIDWITAISGNPFADVARTSLMLQYASLPLEIPGWAQIIIKTLRQKFCQDYIMYYLYQAKGSLMNVREWELPIAAARLSEKIPDTEKEKLLLHIHQLLSIL